VTRLCYSCAHWPISLGMGHDDGSGMLGPSPSLLHLFMADTFTAALSYCLQPTLNSYTRKA
jgi:hypothetical protein